MLLEVAVGLPDLDPRARGHRGANPTRSWCSPRTTPASSPRRSSAAASTCGLTIPRSSGEMEIVRLHTPEIDEQLARRLVEVIHMVRQLDLKKAAPRSPSRSTGARRSAPAGRRRHRTGALFTRTMSIIVKHRTDMDLVAERVGDEARRRPGPRRGSGGMSELPPGLAPRLVSFCEELRGEGVAIGTSEILDAFEGPRHRPLDARGRTSARRLRPPSQKSQEDRRVFELLFDRYFFSRGGGPRRSNAASARIAATTAGDSSFDLNELREAVRQAIADGRGRRDARDPREGSRSAAISGARAEGSGVIGVDVPADSPGRSGLQSQGRGQKRRTSSRSTASRSISSSATFAASSSGT